MKLIKNIILGVFFVTCFLVGFAIGEHINRWLNNSIPDTYHADYSIYTNQDIIHIGHSDRHVFTESGHYDIYFSSDRDMREFIELLSVSHTRDLTGLRIVERVDDRDDVNHVYFHNDLVGSLKNMSEGLADFTRIGECK